MVTFKGIKGILEMAGFSIFVNFYLSIRFSALFTEDSDGIHFLGHAIWAMKALFDPCRETLKMIPM